MIRRLVNRVFAAVLLACLCAGVAAPAQVRGRKAPAFNPAGTFTAQNSPEAPAPKIDGDLILSVELRKAGSGYGGSLVVLTRGNRTVSYRFGGATLGPDKLTFTTGPVRGVAYHFEGKFTRGGDFARDAARRGEDVLEGVLEGRVTKVSGGRELGAAGLRFDFQVGG